MDKFSKQDVINYADGEMEASTIKSFEEALREDADLQAALKLYQSVKGTLKSHIAPDKADAEFKATLKQFNQQHFKKPKAKIIAFSKIWYAAAVLVIGLLVWAPWNQNLYNKYADTEMVSFAERGNNDQADLQKATDAFNEGKFEEVEKILSPLMEQDSTNDMIRFYLGVAQLETDSITVARTNLIKVASKESLLKYDATFYVALSYLKEKDKAQCKVWLNKIPKDADVYSKAEGLLKEL